MNNYRSTSNHVTIMDIWIPIVCFHGLIINISPGNAIGQYVNMGCALFSVFYFIRKGVFRKVKYILSLFFFFFISISISTYLVREHNILGHEKLASSFTPILLVCQLLSFLGLALYTRRRDGWHTTIKSLFVVSTIYIAIMSIYAISIGPNDDSDRYFLFQNKFDFSYLILFWLVLYRMLHPQWTWFYKIKYGLLSLFSLFMTTWIGCSTGYLCIAFVWLCILLEKKLPAFLFKKSCLILALPILDLSFFFFYSFILDIPSVSYFIENVLGKDSSLTGRIYIYQEISNIIMNNPFFGVGPRNGTIAMAYLLNLPNAQNALLYLYLEIGCIGLFLYFWIYYKIIEKSTINNYNSSLIIFLYGMILASMVEINIGVNYLCYICLLMIPTINNQLNYENYKLQVRTR